MFIIAHSLKSKGWIIPLLCSFILLFDLAIIQSALYETDRQLLTIAISIDYVLVVPALYFIFTRQQKQRRLIQLIPLIFIGYLALHVFIPDEGQSVVQFISYIVFPLELMAIGYLIFRGRSLYAQMKSNGASAHHPVEQIRCWLEAMLHSKRIEYVVYEFSVLYYVLCSWRKKPFIPSQSTSFSYHKDSSYLITVLMVSKILVLEGILFHFLIAQWSHLAAWLLTISNLYIIMQLVADYRAMCKNPILMMTQGIQLRYGLQMSATIDYGQVESISVMKFSPLTKDELKTALVPLIVESNVLITLKEKISVTQMFGLKKSVSHIYVFVDKPHEFSCEWERRVES